MRLALTQRWRQWLRNRWVLGIGLGLLGLLLLALLLHGGGPTGGPASSGSGASGASEASRQWRSELFNYAMDNLNRLEEFDSAEMASQIVQRLEAFSTAPDPSRQTLSDPLLATWPEPEVLKEIVNRLGQWSRSQPPPTAWKPDPLLAALPQPLKDLPAVQQLDKLEFSLRDGFALQEALWLRDVAHWVCGEEIDELVCAQRLFDWTVRNIQLEPSAADPDSGLSRRIPQFPWETLLLGRGTTIERAWVFLLLARQQGIDAALLALGDPGGDPQAPPRAWCVAVLSGGQLYLFEPALGLPIPGPNGVSRGSDGQVSFQPATLSQVLQNEALLRQLDVDLLNPYPVQAADLKHVVALLEASPAYLSRRMKLVEGRLAGPQKAVLSAAPSAQAERFKAARNLARVGLWTFPLETLRWRSQLSPVGIDGISPAGVVQRLAALLPVYSSTPLYRGRLLYLKGKFTGSGGAIQSLMAARPRNDELVEMGRKQAAQYRQLFQKAYPQVSQQNVEQMAVKQAQHEINLGFQAKLTASYWLGLIAFQRQNYAAAVDYFAQRTLAAAPDGPWTLGAKYNLARAYEASGQIDKAVELLQSDPGSPGSQGNRLRARWLKQQGD